MERVRKVSLCMGCFFLWGRVLLVGRKKLTSVKKAEIDIKKWWVSIIYDYFLPPSRLKTNLVIPEQIYKESSDQM